MPFFTALSNILLSATAAQGPDTFPLILVMLARSIEFGWVLSSFLGEPCVPDILQ